MNEIAKCPVCGKQPNVQHWSCEAGDYSVYCCGVTADGWKIWNQYAAAMELARELAKLEKCERIGPEYRRLEKSIAQMEYHVIKVFGGE